MCHRSPIVSKVWQSFSQYKELWRWLRAQLYQLSVETEMSYIYQWRDGIGSSGFCSNSRTEKRQNSHLLWSLKMTLTWQDRQAVRMGGSLNSSNLVSMCNGVEKCPQISKPLTLSNYSKGIQNCLRKLEMDLDGRMEEYFLQSRPLSSVWPG